MACQIACAGPVFAQLPTSALHAILSLSDSAQAALTAFKLKKEAISLNMDIQLAPLQAKQAVLTKAIGDLRQQVQVIPPNLVVQCPPLGNINTALETALLGPLESAENILFNINRLSSIKSGLIAEIAQVDDAITFFKSVSTCVNEALSTSTI